MNRLFLAMAMAQFPPDFIVDERPFLPESVHPAKTRREKRKEAAAEKKARKKALRAGKGSWNGESKLCSFRDDEMDHGT